MSIIAIAERILTEPTKRKAVPQAWRPMILHQQMFCCAICGDLLTLKDGWDWDHRLPLALGGEHALSNVQAACIPCHKLKTREDIRKIRKAARIRARADHSRRRRKAITSRGFDKSLRRKMSGEVVKQTSAPADDTDAV